MTDMIDYGPIGPFETPLIQSMMQGSGGSSSQSFNLNREAIFVARLGERPIGFVCGHRGYGASSHILVMSESYLHPAFERTSYQAEMEHCFVTWAQQIWGLTHLQPRRNSATISIDDFVHTPLKPAIPLDDEPETALDFMEELTPA